MSEHQSGRDITWACIYHDHADLYACRGQASSKSAGSAGRVRDKITDYIEFVYNTLCPLPCLEDHTITSYV